MMPKTAQYSRDIVRCFRGRSAGRGKIGLSQGPPPGRSPSGREDKQLL